ncbi:sigma-B regulation protein RsbU (phosphoserine phosphatase) [Cyclonatronum proteinivorum]|uniref:Sigma-B regulation protein RsbU (Phosphoserine phosphatase) n=1 Tax=Cyclonatronum proteinivorum TaxID=1457365 RepID=A0A345UHG0_9BACT|nr:SpoIIE family protein phosphatase [Cyclonatronum proteinivorum]AXI99911.1 sigma-B regulation protein RsbU (phosphoserine phosphatase) [Cyclonatronum proteinivorum]
MPLSQPSNESLRSRFELKTLLDTSRLLIESHDTDFILNNLLLIVMGKLFTPKSAIVLRDDDGKGWQLMRAKGRTGLKEGCRFSPGPHEDNPDKPCLTLHELPKSFAACFEETGLQFFFPIRTSTELLGYLCAAPKVGGKPYSKTELEFVENLVIISAVALSNSMLVSRLRSTNRELDQKVQELNTLFEVSREFNALVDRSQVLSVFRFTLMGQMMVRRFFFLTRLEGQPQFILQQGLKGSITKVEKEQLLLTDAECVFTHELAAAPAYLTDNQIEVLVMVKLQDECAVLGLGAKASGQPYSKSDINLLISLGNLAFLSIQKTFLLEERIEKERMEEELTIARTIQNTLFPSPLPAPEPFDIAALNIPSRQVGGDYFDVLCADDRHLYMVIADVTGKGIPASLLMANLQAMIHVLSPLKLDIAETTGKINDIIFANTPSDKFISFFWGRADLETQVFEYCNAGHNPPVYWDAQKGKTGLLTEGGMLLGALNTMIPYQSGKVQLYTGDVVVMFTDGISEAMNEADEEFGEERIAEIVAAHHHKTAQEIKQLILDEVKTFCKGNYGDDVTMLVFKMNPQ